MRRCREQRARALSMKQPHSKPSTQTTLRCVTVIMTVKILIRWMSKGKGSEDKNSDNRRDEKTTARRGLKSDQSTPRGRAAEAEEANTWSALHRDGVQPSTHTPRKRLASRRSGVDKERRQRMSSAATASTPVTADTGCCRTSELGST
jgi:hypothetical protein